MTSTVDRSSQSLKSTQHTETTKLNGAGGLSDMKVLQALNAAVIITDVAGLVTYWNPFAERLYGWTSEEVVGHSIMGITVATETAEEAARHMAQLQAGESWAGEFGVRCKDGKFLPALVTLSPLRDENGVTVGIVGISQDLSGRKQVEEQLRAARAELERRVEERTEELRKANASLRDLSARLLQIRDQEARRLARELHDSVGQILAAIGMNLATVQAQAGRLDQAGAQAVADSEVLVKQISDEIRTISYLLHPPMLDEGGLASALHWYVDGFRSRSKIQVELEVAPDLGRLSADMETTIFRMVQECLTNIHRHSGSQTAVIRVSKKGAQIVVAAEDSGIGIPQEKLGLTLEGWSGVGFRGMAERIRHVGGKLEIRSTNAGTIVTATLPLKRANDFEERDAVA